jgi:hypothetical protein
LVLSQRLFQEGLPEFILAILRSTFLFWGRKVSSPNPWKANTLEWTTEIVPGHGNWKGAVPTVHRWPYDCSLNEKENIPQTEPDEATHTRSILPLPHHK